MRNENVDERGRMAAAYREGLGLAAVVALRDAGGARIIALAPGNGGAVESVDEELVRLWCRREAEAVCVAAAAAKILRRKPDGDAGAAILAAGKRLGIALQTDGEIAGEAMTVAARVGSEMQKRQQSGELKSINQAYRSYRLETSARGERAMRYDAWMQRYREDLVRKVAAALRQI
jgi:hypothetical protein